MMSGVYTDHFMRLRIAMMFVNVCIAATSACMLACIYIICILNFIISQLRIAIRAMPLHAVVYSCPSN